MRATDGILSQNDLMLTETDVKMMVRKILDALRVDISGTNHFSILLQHNEMRDQTILSFLSENLQIWIKIAG